MNLRPLRPERSALAKLSHTPCEGNLVASMVKSSGNGEGDGGVEGCPDGGDRVGVRSKDQSQLFRSWLASSLAGVNFTDWSGS